MPGFFGFLFGKGNHDRARRDVYRPSVVAKNAISPINHYGTCFACEGVGRKTRTCGPCRGTGRHVRTCRACRGGGQFERPAQACHTCERTGRIRGEACRRCGGTGLHRPAVSEPCRSCNGEGGLAETCRTCSGVGHFSETCRKCEGTGWHKTRR